jgi:hypothetical protein
MDLTTLITACTLTVDPKIMHALTWHQSGGEPWAFSMSGQHHPLLRSMEDAVRAARDTQPNTVSSGSVSAMSEDSQTAHPVACRARFPAPGPRCRSREGAR